MHRIINDNTPSVVLTVQGEPASKSNSRRMIWAQKRLIKSAKALSYTDLFRAQVKPLKELLTGRLGIKITVWYASERPDLDVSLILDLLQGVVYKNDRQVREQHLYHEIDRVNPRCQIEVWSL